jgi:hypothetical protein
MTSTDRLKTLGRLALLAFLTVQTSIPQRPGGEIRRRTDAQGKEYFEVFAEHPRGNHAYPAPARFEGQTVHLPRRVTIRAESTWIIAPGPDGTISADGKSPGTCAGRGLSCPAPDLPWGVLLARWVKLESAFAGSTPVTGWMRVGRQAMLELPLGISLHAVNANAPFPEFNARAEFHYSPLIGLQFVCNDGEGRYADNDGWLHVYQDWTW